MTPAEVDEYRRQLDGVKVRGKDVPKPVKNWHQVRRGGGPSAVQACRRPRARAFGLFACLLHCCSTCRASYQCMA